MRILSNGGNIHRHRNLVAWLLGPQRLREQETGLAPIFRTSMRVLVSFVWSGFFKPQGGVFVNLEGLPALVMSPRSTIKAFMTSVTYVSPA